LDFVARMGGEDWLLLCLDLSGRRNWSSWLVSALIIDWLLLADNNSFIPVIQVLVGFCLLIPLVNFVSSSHPLFGPLS
jgi:hypothetical protein